MAELLLKYELLAPLGKQQLLEYLNLLISTKERVNNNLWISGRFVFAKTTIFLCE
ncbi:MAG: hypothetical protein ACKVUS_05820 [Saprospiraceae bacterium]